MTTPTSPQPTLREYLQVRRANLARFKRVQLFEIFDRTVLDHLPVRLSKCDRYSNILTQSTLKYVCIDEYPTVSRHRHSRLRRGHRVRARTM